MTRPCENANFCRFCECAYYRDGESERCERDSCVVNTTIVKWWEMSLQPYPLITSSPPVGMNQVHNIYTEKIGDTYQLRVVVETEPKE